MINKYVIILIAIFISAVLVGTGTSELLTKFEYSEDGLRSMEFKDNIVLKGEIQIWPGKYFQSKKDSDFDRIPDTYDGGFILDFDNDGLPSQNDSDEDNDGIEDYTFGGPDMVLTMPPRGIWPAVSIYIGPGDRPPARFQFRLAQTDNWTDFEYANYDTWYLDFNSTHYDNGEYDAQFRWNADYNYTGGEWVYEPHLYNFTITIDNAKPIPITWIVLPAAIIATVAIAVYFLRSRLLKIGPPDE